LNGKRKVEKVGDIYNLIERWIIEGKITFSKITIYEDRVSYRLSGHIGRKEKILDQMILELTESVMAPYGVFSFIRRLDYVMARRTKAYKKYESKQGLANDIYDHLTATKTEPVWRTNQSVALWSHGHHRKLVQYLDEKCRSKHRLNPYWAGEFFMHGFRNVSPAETGHAMWKKLCAADFFADIYVIYNESPLFIDFELHYRDHDEEKRICRLVKAACDRHGVKPILENIDPSMMELGYEA